MPADAALPRNDLVDAAERLEGAARTLAERAQTLREKAAGRTATVARRTIAQELDAVENAASATDTALESLQSVIGDEALAIADFFHDVGAAMLTAQRRLDEESERYMGQVVQAPDVAPATYRIPRVEADMRFALDRRESRKFSVFVYGEESSTVERNQQRVSFEIVSAPASPEAVQSLRSRAPGMELVVSPVARGEMLSVLAAVRPRPARLVELLERWPEALVFRFRLPSVPTDPASVLERWLVALAHEREQDGGLQYAVDVWNVQPGELAFAQQVDRLAFDSKTMIRRTLYELGRAQRAMLGST